MESQLITQLQEELAAERALTASYDKCLDEALEVVADAHKTIARQHAAIEELKAMNARYKELLDDKLFTMATEMLEQLGPSERTLWERGEQHAFRGDAE